MGRRHPGGGRRPDSTTRAGWISSRHPHSEELRIQERFHRRDFGHMDLTVTVEDPEMYTRPITIKVTELLVPDSDILENICNENEKDRTHLDKALGRN